MDKLSVWVLGLLVATLKSEYDYKMVNRGYLFVLFINN